MDDNYDIAYTIASDAYDEDNNLNKINNQPIIISSDDYPF